MKYGKIAYLCRGRRSGQNGRVKSVVLTIIARDDDEELSLHGIRGLRLKRLLRLACEADSQGCRLGYEDLSALLLTSLATLKRDVSYLEAEGVVVPLRGRRRCRGSEAGYEEHRSVA